MTDWPDDDFRIEKAVGVLAFRVFCVLQLLQQGLLSSFALSSSLPAVISQRLLQLPEPPLLGLDGMATCWLWGAVYSKVRG